MKILQFSINYTVPMQKYAPICPRFTRGIVNVDPSTLATYVCVCLGYVCCRNKSNMAHDKATCKLKRERSKDTNYSEYLENC